MNLRFFVDRLLLWKKFAILSIVALTLATIPTCFYIQKSNSIIRASQREVNGMPPAIDALKIVQLTQQHRGLSGLALSGVAGAGEKRAAKQGEIDQAYGVLNQALAGAHDSKLLEQWGAAQRDWETLRNSVSDGHLTVAESFAQQSALLSKLLVLSNQIADAYGLSQDPDIPTSELLNLTFYQLPYLTEEFGKMRGKGGALLATKTASVADRGAMIGFIAKGGDRLLQVNSAFDKAVAANPEFGNSLGDQVKAMTDLANGTMQLASEKIVMPETLDYPSSDFADTDTQAINAQFKVIDAASAALKTELEKRSDKLQTVEWTVLSIMLVLIAFAALLQYTITRSVSEPLKEAISIAERVASGDLTSKFHAEHANEIGRLMTALRAMNDSLTQIVNDVRSGIDNIGDAVADIASGNADLSARTESQAASLEETASSMEEITATVRQNADNANQANQLVGNASSLAVKGGNVVSKVVDTMGEINTSSQKIVEIISVIDGIAFQTNILALNAAVEAARAGEQGRGFAVVASEVRNLAQRSASAAKEIKELIHSSVERVQAGSRLVDEAGSSMGEIVASVKRVDEIMRDIARASREQTTGIEQVNQAVLQMDETTQQNSALVEQASAASESLNDQAKMLRASISIFKLHDGDEAFRAT